MSRRSHADVNPAFQSIFRTASGRKYRHLPVIKRHDDFIHREACREHQRGSEQKVPIRNIKYFQEGFHRGPWETALIVAFVSAVCCTTRAAALCLPGPAALYAVFRAPSWRADSSGIPTLFLKIR